MLLISYPVHRTRDRIRWVSHLLSRSLRPHPLCLSPRTRKTLKTSQNCRPRIPYNICSLDRVMSDRLTSSSVSPSLSLFFDNVHHLAFPYPVHRFRRRLSLPQSDMRSPHQTLVYAILAFACHFASGRVASQQECFITKARSGLCDSSGRSAKPRDYILAGSILARAVLFRGDAAAALRLSFGRSNLTLVFGLFINSSTYQTPFRRLCD